MIGIVTGSIDAGQAGQAEHVDAAATPGEFVELPHHSGRRHGDRERGEREIDAGEAESRKTEEEARKPGHEPGDRDRPDVRHVAREGVRPELQPLVRDEDRGRVTPDQHEGPVPERDLPGDPREQVEAEQGDEVDADVGELLRAKVADEARQQEDRRRREQEAENPDQLAALHTRLVTGLPKSPAGRTSSTTRMIRSATGSFRSAPTKSL